MYRVFSLSGCLPRLTRSSDARSLYRTALFDLRGRARDAPARYGRSGGGIARSPRYRLLQYHEMLYQGLSGGDSNHVQPNHSVDRTCGVGVFGSAWTELAD